MKKTLSLLVIGGMLAFVACGPSEAEKKAAEQKRLDSIAQVEKTKLDSLAKMAEEAAAKAAAAEAEAKHAEAEAHAAKKDLKDEKAKEASKAKGFTKAAPVTKEATKETKPANLGKKGDANKTNNTGTLQKGH